MELSCSDAIFSSHIPSISIAACGNMCLSSHLVLDLTSAGMTEAGAGGGGGDGKK